MKIKVRSDHNYVLYRIVHTPTGRQYIGVTLPCDRAFYRAVKLRFRKHWSAAKSCNQLHGRPLYAAMQEHGIGCFKAELVEVVRGRAAAFQRELELIKLHRPELNHAHVANVD